MTPASALRDLLELIDRVGIATDADELAHALGTITKRTASGVHIGPASAAIAAVRIDTRANQLTVTLELAVPVRGAALEEALGPFSFTPTEFGDDPQTYARWVDGASGRRVLVTTFVRAGIPFGMSTTLRHFEITGF